MAREVNAAVIRHGNEHNARAWLAWHVAALYRSKKLPALKTMLWREKKRRQTWQEQLKIAELWQSLYDSGKK